MFIKDKKMDGETLRLAKADTKVVARLEQEDVVRNENVPKNSKKSCMPYYMN